MDFSQFDQRHYPTVGAREGYTEWAATYEDTVLDLMDKRLLSRLQSVSWAHASHTLDLACGTGRTGAWLRAAGVTQLDGIDLTEAMLERARAKNLYGSLRLGDVTATGLADATYDLATMSLADEHLADLAPLYREVARLLRPAGSFVLVGYHPYFLLKGIPTHFNRAGGEPLAIESHVHLLSDHVGAGLAAGLQLVEMVEGLVDDYWIAARPRWAERRGWPVSFALVWRKKERGL